MVCATVHEARPRCALVLPLGQTDRQIDGLLQQWCAGRRQRHRRWFQPRAPALLPVLPLYKSLPPSATHGPCSATPAFSCSTASERALVPWTDHSASGCTHCSATRARSGGGAARAPQELSPSPPLYSSGCLLVHVIVLAYSEHPGSKRERPVAPAAASHCFASVCRFVRKEAVAACWPLLSTRGRHSNCGPLHHQTIRSRRLAFGALTSVSVRLPE